MGIFDLAPGGSAVGNLMSGVRGILGKAPPDRNASKRLRKTFRQAKAGDPAALLKLQQMAVNQGSKFKNINAKARKYYGLVSGMGQPSMAPGRTDNYGGGTWVEPSGGSAQPATWDSPVMSPQSRPVLRAQRPCKYGPRDAAGYCPPKPASGSGSRMLSSTGSQSGSRRTSRPCKYGPRGADGYCPTKSAGRSAASGVASKLSGAAQRRAMTAGGNLAVKAAPYLATAALVGAAGIAAYYITKQLMRIRFKTWDELKAEAAMAYKLARRQAGEEAGRGLTPAESSQLSQWFKGRMQALSIAERSGQKPSGLINLTFGD